MLPLNNKPFIEKDNTKLDNEWNMGLLLSIDNAYDTNVKKYSFAKHLILIFCLVVTCTVLMIVIITHRISDDPPSSKIYYWNINGTVYEILTESFQDTSPKSDNGLRFGDGVGDIKGIRKRLNYIKTVVKSNILYINSMYESNDDDHMTLVDQRKIAPVFGTMDDFDMLLKDTQKMAIAVIMDFIPNHTGRMSEWFLKSQKKEGKYSDYYIWARCDPSKGIYPNKWMKKTGGSAWSYDETRKECFYHQLEEDKPDLNLWNPDVRQELENILRFWLDKGVDGFHIQNVQYLYEDQDLNKGDYHLYDEIGKESNTFENNQTWNHHENTKILQAWKAVLDTYEEEKVLFITAEDETLNTSLRYIKAGVTAVRVNPLSSDRASMAEGIESKLKEANFGRAGWMFNDKYSSRLARPELTNALLTLQATLPGVAFNYYGNEIGMTDHPTLPSPLKYRTPMQWNPDGTGFSKNRPWLPQNPNYTTVNVETEKAVANIFTPLTVFKILQKLREKESFQSGEMRVFRDGDLLMYIRKAEGFPGYLVAINFGKKRVTESFYKVTGIPPQVKVVFHSHKPDNTAIDLSRNSYILDPYQAVVLEYE